MSARDAVGRRRFAVKVLLENMRLTENGWTLNQMVKLIVREYGFGIRDETAKRIVKQLGDHDIIYKKGLHFYLRKTRR